MTPTISEKLERVKDIKTDIRTAANEKGAGILLSDPFDAYADKIRQIPQEAALDIPMYVGALASSGTIRAIACSEEMVIAVCEKTVACSYDGLTWTRYNFSVSNAAFSGYHATYGNGAFVILGNGNLNIAMRSTDGKSWEEITLPVFISVGFLKYVEDRFFIFPNNALVGLSSYDGITWTTFPFVANVKVTDVCYGENAFIATASGINVYYSENGYAWQAVATPMNAVWSKSVYWQDRYVALANNSDYLGAFSYDGQSWTLFGQRLIWSQILFPIDDALYGLFLTGSDPLVYGEKVSHVFSEEEYIKTVRTLDIGRPSSYGMITSAVGLGNIFFIIGNLPSMGVIPISYLRGLLNDST